MQQVQFKTTKRTLSYHPSYSSEFSNGGVPCLRIGSKELAKKYDWKINDEVLVTELPDGIYITKIEENNDIRFLKSM